MFSASKTRKREGLVFDGNATTAFLKEGLGLNNAACAAAFNVGNVGLCKKQKRASERSSEAITPGMRNWGRNGVE